MEAYKRIILGQYFDDIDDGYGWVEYSKVITDMQLGYDLDITEKDLDEYLSKANLIDIAYDDDGNKILIVNDNLDFELDILPILRDQKN